MKLDRMNFIVGIFLVIVIIMLPSGNVEASVDDTNEKKTDIEVRIIETKESTSDTKETIYTPKKAVPVRILPNTGEIITTFIYIIIGLSFLFFFVGLLLNRILYKEIRWDY